MVMRPRSPCRSRLRSWYKWHSKQSARAPAVGDPWHLRQSSIDCNSTSLVSVLLAAR